MSDCSSGICKEHNRFMEEIYEMKADQKYMKDTVDRIEQTLSKFIDGNEERTRKIATEVAVSLISTCQRDIQDKQFKERKFSWQKFTWTAAFLISIIMNMLTAYTQLGH